MTGALVMHFEVIVGAVGKELRPAGAEVGERGDELLGRRGGRLMELDRGHGVHLDLAHLLASHSLFGSGDPSRL
jgi:hypothetical protein